MMALTHVYLTFDTVPTFNTFDTQFRQEWSRLKGKEIRDSYRLWGDEALIPVWTDLASRALETGQNLPPSTVRCLDLMGLGGVVINGESESFEDLYPFPVAQLECCDAELSSVL